MRVVVVVAVICFLSGGACADEWTKADTALQVVSSALIVVDWGMTLGVADHPERWRERNFLLGDHPSRGKVNRYFAGCLIGNALIARVLPQPYRRLWQAGTIGVQGYFVGRNYSMGIRVSF